MRTFSFVTVDVFTDRRFGGNPLAVFPDAQGLSDGEMQSLAAEFNLSETTFVLPPADPANTARVRIFNRTAEMPFAGHPNVGTGWVLAGMGRASDGLLRFEEIAGLVEVRSRRAGVVTIAAPQPLSLGGGDAGRPGGRLRRPRPERRRRRRASARRGIGRQFLRRRRGHARRTDARRARPRPLQGGARSLPAPRPSPPAALPLRPRRQGGEATRLRARMFSPLSGTIEDAATGSAATPLAALLLSLGTADKARYDITQGVEMGRPSLLACTAWRAPTASAPASAAAACRC